MRKAKTKLPQTDSRISQILRHYGITHQSKKTVEELLEFAWAFIVWYVMSRLGFGKQKHTDHLHEELSDLRIMLDQIELATGGRFKCSRIREQKITRQLQRIESEETTC